MLYKTTTKLVDPPVLSLFLSTVSMNRMSKLQCIASDFSLLRLLLSFLRKKNRAARFNSCYDPRHLPFLILILNCSIVLPLANQNTCLKVKDFHLAIANITCLLCFCCLPDRNRPRGELGQTEATMAAG